MAYTERLWIPIWWWVAALAVAALIGYEFGLALRSVPTWVFIAAMMPVAVGFCLWLSRDQISVTHDGPAAREPGSPEGTLDLKGRAHLPLAAISRTVSVPASARSAAMGRQLDPEAYVAQRTWVKTMVLIVLDDPDDPTPYWLISSRHPDRLMAALGSARIEAPR